MPYPAVGKLGVYQVIRKFAAAIGVLGICTLPATATAQEISDWPDELQCRSNPPTSLIKAGWCLSIDRNKGNCVACHMLNINPWPKTLPISGNIAPPLVAMQPRFPDIEVLRRQVADAPALQPDTTMPPYLRHELLDAEEIERVLQFLLTL